jgi:hypothetical protein
MRFVLQVPKPLAPQELEQLKQEIAAELHAQMATDTGSKHLTEEQLAQVRVPDTLRLLLATVALCMLHTVIARRAFLMQLPTIVATTAARLCVCM